jgi:hypothetical protein
LASVTVLQQVTLRQLRGVQGDGLEIQRFAEIQSETAGLPRTGRQMVPAKNNIEAGD